MSRSWGHEVFVAVDQLINAALFAGWADETISARCYRLGVKAKRAGLWDQWRIGWVSVDVLFCWQDAWLRYRTGVWPDAGHCERACRAEYARTQLPPEYRS